MSQNVIKSAVPGIYRSVIKSKNTTLTLHKPKKTMRRPHNVPYIVDNLWEWKRPGDFPSRRFSAFASPQQYLAKEDGPEGGTVFLVKFKNRVKVCQLTGTKDSKYHRDIGLFNKLMPSIVEQLSIKEKIVYEKELEILSTPCLTKNDIDALFEKFEILKELRDEIYTAITYWDDVKLIKDVNNILDEKGEIFFQAVDGYYLRSLEESLETKNGPGKMNI
ncbi:MAG TPA: hypothetical protein VK186_21380 [Candidatus Deferrimicrobium sp.]|nr:hypothetical protein [Candidatus Deferrimicrobium sp.]